MSETTGSQLPAGTREPSAHGGSQARGIWIALASSAAFGISGSFARGLFEAGWSPTAAVAARMAGAAIVLAIPAVLAMRGRWVLVRTNWLSILLFGLFGVGACQLCYFLAVQRLDVGVALLLEYLAPVLIVLVLWVRHQKRPSAATIAGTLLSLLGLIAVLDLTGASKIDPIGVLWGLGAAVGLTVYFFISAKVDGALPPIMLSAGGMAVGAITMLLVGALGILPMTFAAGSGSFAGFQTPWWAALIGLIMIATVFSYTTGVMAARALGSKVASFISLTEVLFAVLWAWLLLSELPGLVQLFGGLLIVAGVVLVRVDELRALRKRQ
ncbi:EamA family transporter [Glutamicibacter halophytocola]|uniref:EamA family transporter n=1 Tax=Glutamicibacter halophytocola TaxID=1933880 RepID=UPI0015C56A6D|nr:EamA family transporter [Glutamicibacter halophytocola]NQD41203.1 EamA family transporter [Glutamicibacter halophytocola]